MAMLKCVGLIFGSAFMFHKKDKAKRYLNTPQVSNSLQEEQISEAVSKALQSFYPRMSTFDNYSQQLAVVDKQISTLVQRLATQTTFSYWITFALYVLSSGSALVLVSFGLSFILRQQLNSASTPNVVGIDLSIAGIICIVAGVIILLVLLNRNPLKNMRYLMSNMIRMSIIFSGYVRQIHQVDLVFKNLFVNGGDIAPDKLDELFKYQQDAVEEAMGAISQTPNEMEDWVH